MIFRVFINPFVYSVLDWTTFLLPFVGINTTGIFIFMMFYKPAVDFSLVLTNLYLTNSAYEGFHTTLAPGLSDSYIGNMPSVFGF